MMTEAPNPEKLLVDRTLGRLVRWLRLLGYDTIWDKEAGPAALLLRAEREGRVLLTRDTLLVERRVVHLRRVSAVLLRGDLLLEQLQQLQADEGLRRVGPPRCLVCNGSLDALGAEEVCHRVPVYVAATQEKYTYCSVCDRVTWPATHWDDMRRRLAEAGIVDA